MFHCRPLRTPTSRPVMSGNGGRGYDSTEFRLPPAQANSDDTPSCSTTDACDWQVVSASVRGAAHERNDAPNQDALSWWTAEGNKPLAVLCVADGHGGSEYTRSHIGARRAVKEAQMLLVFEVLPRILEGGALMDLAQFKRHLNQQLPKDLVKRWRASVYEHATDNPIPKDETLCSDREEIAHSAAAKTDTPVEQLYGATLLAVLLSPELHLYIQLGDGDILTVSQEGEVARPPFPGGQPPARQSHHLPVFERGLAFRAHPFSADCRKAAGPRHAGDRWICKLIRR